MTNDWNKIENEAGYPCYVFNKSNRQQYDHPHFDFILESLCKYDGMKYSAYRTAFKINFLQNHLKVPPLRISSGVLERHRLSLSESSLSLDASELEAVLADIYFAAEKEGLFDGNVDLAVDLLLNLLLNVYDRERKEPIRVLAAKTMLIVLSQESTIDKWSALANCAADHNGCVSARRFTTLLMHLAALSIYLGETDSDQCIQSDVDGCFSKNAGMLGVSSRQVCEWAVEHCSYQWLPLLERIQTNKSLPVNNSSPCAFCSDDMTKGLKFKCAKCNDVYICEYCYLYDRHTNNVSGHKRTHLVQEIINGEVQGTQNSFLKGVKKLFFCTKKKRSVKKKIKGRFEEPQEVRGSSRKRKDGKPAMFTSTVGKASGNNVHNPTVMLQDIINQLESQNIALKSLTSTSEDTTNKDDPMKQRVELHFQQIAAQISRLKLLKENISPATQIPLQNTDHNKHSTDQIKAFDLFSPIPIAVDDKSGHEPPKSQPRVLSLDSGNLSMMSKNEDDQALMTMSGDSMKPLVVHATTDSISTVSMNDISFWYNDTESQATDKKVSQLQINLPRTPSEVAHSLCITEKRFDADLRSVASSNDKMKELNADLDTVLNRLQEILSHNFAMDDSCFDNSQLRETANEMEGLLGSLIRGVEQRTTLSKSSKQCPPNQVSGRC